MKKYFSMYCEGEGIALCFLYTSTYWEPRSSHDLKENSYLECYYTNSYSTDEYVSLERFGFRNSKYLK
jgi:hypothetical protein